MRVETEVSGLTQLSSSLHAAKAAVREPRDALEEVYARWLAANRQRFASGAPWAELAASTKAKKRKAGKPAEPLAGGPLEDSLTSSRSAGAIGEIHGGTLTMGTRRPEANLAKGGRGSPGSRGYMPPRRPVLFDRTEQRQAANIVGNSITTTLISGKTRKTRARGV